MNKIASELSSNAVDVLPEGELTRRLGRGTPLRVKLGVDPTAPDIHIGFAVPLSMMAAFQQAGHIAVLIIGDYTARIGDPSGRSKERPLLSGELIDSNAERFKEQAFQILDPELTEVRFNSEWLRELDFAEILRLTRTTTVAQLLERDDFAKRREAGEPISISELLYPLMQGLDSVAVEADVELGGTDQLYNLLMARDIMAAYDVEPQVAMTLPLLVGTDGVEKMSKSRGNYIGIADPPEEQFGKVMSIPDAALSDYWRLCLWADAPDITPMESKLTLARKIVERYHGETAAADAQSHFTRVVREREVPDDFPTVRLPSGPVLHLPAFLKEHLGESASHWRRVVVQGGLRIDGEPVRELDLATAGLTSIVLQAGKRRFLRVEFS
jgi:tyrosyl-tRNA synthetase